MSQGSTTGRPEWEVYGTGGETEAPKHRSSTAWAGWVGFAAVMMLVVGMFNVIDGLVALFNSSWYVTTSKGLLTLDFTAWGWFMLATGGLAIITGIGVLAGQTWARVIGVVLVSINALGQLAFVAAYPIWSILIIALDVVVIYALTAHGKELASY